MITKKTIFRAAAAFVLCGALASSAPALDWKDVDVKVPGKEDVPLDSESVENVKANAGRRYGGSMTDGAALSTESGGEFNTYQSSFEVIWYDQWKASLKRFSSLKAEDGELKILATRDLKDSNAFIPERAQNRNIKFWSFADRRFVDLDDSSKDAFAAITGIDAIKVRSGDLLVPWDLSSSPKEKYRDIKPVDAYISWLKGYDMSYANALVGSDDEYINIPRAHSLTDIGQGAMIINGPPDIYDSLPGYRDWARDGLRTGRKPSMYVQTNDGIFHVVDPEIMTETSALILPSSMLPGRLASTKTDAAGAWIDVSVDISDGVHRSDPVFLLDGPMQLRHFNLVDGSDRPTDWRTYLIGTLERAGNGIYMMDVDDPADPKLMWYREVIHDYSRSHAGSDGWADRDADNNLDTVTMLYSRDGAQPSIVQRDLKWEGHDGEVDVHDPAEPLWPAWMGYNIPKPGPAVIGKITERSDGIKEIDLRNIIVVGGGLKSKIVRYGVGVDRRLGAEGSAIFILDAKSGEILKMFNSRSESINDPNFYVDITANDGNAPANVGNIGAIQSGMDMVVSEPTFIRTADSRYIAGGVILCTQAGKIFLVRFGEEGEESNADPKSWRIATLADIDDMHVLFGISSSSAITHGVAVTRGVGDTTNDIWVTGVTSNTVSRTDMGGCGDLSNTRQQIFSFKDSFDPRSDKAYQTLYDWKDLTKRDDSILAAGDAAFSSDWQGMPGENFSGTAKGWHLFLDTADGRHAAEYGTTRPLIASYKGRQMMFVSTYKHGLGSTSSVSYIYALDVETGEPLLWSIGDEKTKGKGFTGIKITGMTLSEKGGRTTVVVTYDKTNSTNDVKTRMGDEDFLHKVGDDASDIDAFVIDLGSNSTMHFNSGASIVDYWISK